MRWVCSISSAANFTAAIDEVASTITDRLEGARPDLVFAFVTPAHAEHYSRVPPELSERLDPKSLAGCSGAGVLADGIEIEQGPGLAVAAAVLPGADCRVFHLDAGELPESSEHGSWWTERLGPVFDSATGLVLLPDPTSVDTSSMLEQLDASFPDVVKVGGLASGGTKSGQNMLYANDHGHRSGVVGVALAGAIRTRTVVAQGCRPVGDPMFVTRAEGNVIQELDGRSPAKVLQELYERLDTGDRALMRHSLFVGLTMSEHQQVYAMGDFLVRNIVGLDTRNGSMAVGAPMRRNMVVQFHLREPKTATEELEALLSQETRSPSGGLLFSCLGRGKTLFDEPHHDSRIFRAQMGPVPLAGFFCAGEIGPVGNTTHVHGYTSAFALLSSIQTQDS